MLKKLQVLGVAVVALTWSLVVLAQVPIGPREVVVDVTQSLQQLVVNHDASKDPEGKLLLSEMQKVLDPVVDFGFIARIVMGDSAGQANKSQMQRFEQAFRVSLVSTYAKGMSGYVSSEMIIPPLPAETQGQNRVAVRQEVRSGSAVQLIDYTMVKSRSTGEWKLINVVLNGINLGKTFRSQFAQALKEKNGDLDKVIDSWGQVAQSQS